jgi:hypothetical protein
VEDFRIKIISENLLNIVLNNLKNVKTKHTHRLAVGR